MAKKKSGFTTISEKERKAKWDKHQANKDAGRYGLNPINLIESTLGLEKPIQTNGEKKDTYSHRAMVEKYGLDLANHPKLENADKNSGTKHSKVGDSGIARADNINVDPNYTPPPSRKPKTRKTLLGGLQNSLLSPFGLNSAPSIYKPRLVGK